MCIPTVSARRNALVIEVADFTINTKCTCRQTARIFGISKSCVHDYLTKRLPELDGNKASQVRNVLQTNKKLRHIRGGEATRMKHILKRMQSTRRMNNES